MLEIELFPKSTVVATILSAAVVAYLVHTFLQWRRLSHIPGPFWPAISKFWMVRESLKGRQPTWIKELTDRYGELRMLSQQEQS
jgi:hypothetical protein